MSSSQLKSKLIELYLITRLHKESNNQPSSKEEDINILKDKLNKLSCEKLLNYITSSLEVIVDIKVEEKCNKYIQEQEEKNANYNNNEAFLLEQLLTKAEREIREHIKTENELKVRIEELEYQLEQLSHYCFPPKTSNSSKTSLNDLKNENERIKEMLITYQLKDEKHSIAERKLKLQVYKAEKEKKLLSEQLTSLVNNNNNNNNTQSNSLLNNSKPSKTKSQRIVTLSSARKTVKPVSTSSTPKKHRSINIRMNNSAQNYSSKTKKKIEENITHKRNSSIVINKSKARNYFDQLDNSSMKIISMNKKDEKNKKNVNTNIRACHKKSNSTFISPNPSNKKEKKNTHNNNANNKVSRNAKNTNHHHNHNNAHAHNSNNNVIINNYNYINVYTTSGISESEVKSVVKKRLSNNHKHSNSNTINTNNNANTNNKPPLISNKKKK